MTAPLLTLADVAARFQIDADAKALKRIITEHKVPYVRIRREWRNERKGMFGSFHLADPNEEAEWEAFAAGKGPMPVPSKIEVKDLEDGKIVYEQDGGYP